MTATKIPDSLRRILDKQKPKQPEEIQTGDLFLFWRDGEAWKKEPGKAWREIPAIKPIR